MNRCLWGSVRSWGEVAALGFVGFEESSHYWQCHGDSEKERERRRGLAQGDVGVTLCHAGCDANHEGMFREFQQILH